jgi:glycerol-3-phosphate O-acyltransferase / dihydroxyacetone phosphate acyltransferase
MILCSRTLRFEVEWQTVTRRIIVAILRFTLRIYFRRIEIAGLENVPQKGPVIFVLNHPNALVDPVFLLCLAPRRVAFVAKAPLFKMPVLGFFVRALDSLPAYRRQDQGEDVTKNSETFAAARKLLAGGITIGICPEGVSHDEPGLRPIKTGAARIALGAVSTGEVRDLKIVPAGLYYTSKTTFRSAALLYYGKPLEVTPVELEADGNPPRAPVRELSSKIENALREVMLDAQHEEALHTVTRAERIFSSERPAEEGEDSLTAELRLRKQFVKGYTALVEREPQRLSKLQARITRFEEQLRQAGIDAEELSAPQSALAVIKTLLLRCLVFLLLLGPASLGIVIHFPAYRLGGFLAVRLSKGSEQDVISTIKIISAMLFYPLTWLVVAFVVFEFAGWPWALAVLVILPLSGYIAMRFLEEFDAFVGGLRAVAFFLTRRRFFVRLLAERRAIKAEILALGEEAMLATR